MRHPNISTKLGYFPQDHKEALPKGTAPYKWLESFAPQETNEYLRGFFGRMLFRGPERDKLNDALKLFQGSLIFVSHDLDFINSLANRILGITPDGYRFMDLAARWLVLPWLFKPSADSRPFVLS